MGRKPKAAVKPRKTRKLKSDPGPGTPRLVDIHVGSRVRQRRTLLGLSQEKLGQAVGLTFQQIQKYERGSNRIGSSRLFQFSQILNVPISYFFEDMPEDAEATGGRRVALPKGKTPSLSRDDIMTRRETLEFVRAYTGIGDEKVRKEFGLLVKAAGRPTD